MPSDNRGRRLEAVGGTVLRYGLVLVLLWIGGLKFTAYEAEGVHGHASNSPLLAWTYDLLSVGGVSALLGIVEISLAILIATRRSLLGSRQSEAWERLSCSSSP